MIKAVIIVAVLFIAAMLMVSSMDIGDINEQCAEGEAPVVIDNIWTCTKVCIEGGNCNITNMEIKNLTVTNINITNIFGLDNYYNKSQTNTTIEQKIQSKIPDGGVNGMINFWNITKWSPSQKLLWDESTTTFTVGGGYTIDVIPYLQATAYSDYSWFRPVWSMSRARDGNPTYAVSGSDWLGSFSAYGHDGTTFRPSGEIKFIATESFTSTAHGGRITFATTANQNVGSSVDRLTIYHNGFIGINTTTPSYPLEVNSQYNGISIYSSKNISATGYNVRTSVYDKSKGTALSYIKDADQLKSDGVIDHSKFYGYAGTINITDYSKPVVTTKKCTDNSPDCVNGWFTETTYPFSKQEEQVSLDQEVDLLRQAIYELKTELCKKDNSYNFC